MIGLMNKTRPAITNLARRLMALEAACAPSDQPVDAVVLVCQKLRTPLAKLVGVIGFRSLMSRAVAMAKVEVPSLEALQVRPDGSLGECPSGMEWDQVPEGGAVVVAQLLNLLVTIIGESLTLRLVNDAWPNASMARIDAGIEEGS
jgi:hypothetical protein